MTIPEVVDRLAVFLQHVVEGYATELPDSPWAVPIAVYSGYPPIRVEEDARESYIFCVPVKFNDTEDEGTVTVEVNFSLYSPALTDMGRPLFNLVEHCRQALLKKRVLDNRAWLQLPVTGEFLVEQPNPQYKATIILTYTIGQPTEEGLDYDSYQETRAYR